MGRRYDVALLKKRWKAGDSLADLAKLFKCSEVDIASAAHRNGLKRRFPRGTGPLWTLEADKKLIQLWESGMTRLQMAEKLNCSYKRLECRMSTLGLRCLKEKGIRNLTNQQKDLLIKLWPSPMKYKDIHKYLPFDRGFLFFQAKQLGLKRPVAQVIRQGEKCQRR